MAGGLLLLASGLGYAQSLPDAGAVLRQVEPSNRVPLLPRPGAAEPDAASAKDAGPAGGAAVSVRGCRYVGNMLIPAEALGRILASRIGRTLNLAQLREAADALADAYGAAGWVVHTSIPKQDVTEGIVTIQITEAVFGRVRLEESAVQRLSPDRVLAMIDAAQPAGAPLNADALDRALRLADDLPGVTVAGRLHSGVSPGETDLALTLADEPLFIGQLSADNAGARSTGAEQISATLRLSSRLKIGDQAPGQFLHSRGNDYATRLQPAAGSARLACRRERGRTSLQAGSTRIPVSRRARQSEESRRS